MDDSFRYIKQYVLQRITSGHTPWWLQTEDFKERVKECWDSFKYEGGPDYILTAKLKALKVKLKEWSKTRQGNLGVQKQNVLSQLEAIEKILECRALKEEKITSSIALTVRLPGDSGPGKLG
ncbi:hypothetical protein KY284_005705 [Solanum tuberosum]|nr:hypothetical protein KY284_005705 [Solanum tuberosum]